MRKATGRRATLGNHSLYLYIICVVTALLGCKGGDERQGVETPADIKQTVERVMTLAAEALRNEAEIGLCLTHVGRLQEGLAKIDSVMAVLDSVRRFNELDAWLIAAKRKITVL